MHLIQEVVFPIFQFMCLLGGCGYKWDGNMGTGMQGPAIRENTCLNAAGYRLGGNKHTTYCDKKGPCTREKRCTGISDQIYLLLEQSLVRHL